MVTSDGVRLSAWFIPSSKHAAIVAMPGAGSNRTGTHAAGKAGYLPGGVATAPSEWTNRVVAFFDGALRVASGAES